MYKKMMKTVLLILSVHVILLTGCAFDVVRIKQIPTQMSSIEPSKSSWQLVDAINVKLGTGYKSLLESNTKWNYIGKIEHGDVYRTKDQILTVEASNIYEAYIVISKDELVGFYLPVEKTYFPLSTPQKIKQKAIS